MEKPPPPPPPEPEELTAEAPGCSNVLNQDDPELVEWLAQVIADQAVQQLRSNHGA